MEKENKKVKNQKKCHAEQKHLRMTVLLNTCGFTLIEILVVVLIIAILAAIAVPQYQKAVVKARVTQQISLVSSIYPIMENCLLEYGNLTQCSADYNAACEPLDSSIFTGCSVQGMWSVESGARAVANNTLSGHPVYGYGAILIFKGKDGVRCEGGGNKEGSVYGSLCEKFGFTKQCVAGQSHIRCL